MSDRENQWMDKWVDEWMDNKTVKWIEKWKSKRTNKEEGKWISRWMNDDKVGPWLCHDSRSNGSLLANGTIPCYHSQAMQKNTYLHTFLSKNEVLRSLNFTLKTTEKQRRMQERNIVIFQFWKHHSGGKSLFRAPCVTLPSGAWGKLFLSLWFSFLLPKEAIRRPWKTVTILK